MSGIETSTRCSCGTYVVLHHGRRWEATCTSCYGPVEDSPATEMVRGIGETPLDALSDWQEQHDDAWDVTLVVTHPLAPNAMSASVLEQIRGERDRQRGWVNRHGAKLSADGAFVAVDYYGPVTP